MATQIQLRRGTAAEWTSANPTLAEGEIGLELDTSKFKIGNGSDNWAALDYGFESLPVGGATGQILAKDSASDYDYVWIDQQTLPDELSDLTDVDTSAAADNYVLTYDNGTSTWVAEAPATIPDELSDLTDVDTSAAADNYVLSYNNGTSTWVAAEATGGGATQLNDLTDVDIDFLENNDSLFYDAFLGKWTNGTSSGDLPSPYFTEITTSSITNGSHELTGVDIGQQFYNIYRIETSAEARVRIYTTTAGRDADENRSILTAPSENVGCVLDVATTTGLLDIDILPQASGWIRNYSTDFDLPITVTNLSGSTQTITVNIYHIQTAEDLNTES